MVDIEHKNPAPGENVVMSSAARTAQRRTLPLQFTGQSGEYFKIWIVNLLLIVLTLGIYSAWAKVRTKRYFYGNTLLDGSPFDYLASPLSILLGWAIAIGLFGGMTVATMVYPLSQIAFTILFAVLVPVIVVRAMVFRLHNTAYRNVRFAFARNYREAYKVYLGFGLLTVLTLGMLAPYLWYRQKKFAVENSSFGIRNFLFNARAGDFYAIHVFASLAALVLFGIALFAMRLSVIGSVSPGEEGNTLAFRPPVLLIVLIVLGALAVYAYVETTVSNLILNKSDMRGVKFNSTLKVWPMTMLYLTNALGVALSFGLLIPWARIRTARYRLTNIAVYMQVDMDSFIARETDRESAAGSEIGDMFDVDVGV